MDKMSSRSDLCRVLPAVFALALLLAPVVCVAGAEEPRQAGAVITPLDINVTNVSPTDPAILSHYQATPEPIKVRAELNETTFPASKGEMTAGPRGIGFSLDPLVLAAGIVVIAAVGLCALYYLRRNKDTEDKE